MKQNLLNFVWLRACMFVVLVCAAFTGAWAQSNYSMDFTGNVTLSTTGGTSASTCKVKVNGTEYDGIKAGVSKMAGAVQITVPGGTKYLHLHVAAWNGESVTLSVTPNDLSESITLTSNSGISGNSPFTFSGDASSDDFYKVITFANALETDTDLKFTATGGRRFVVWGVTAEEEKGEGDESVATAITIDASGITNTNIFEGATAGGLRAVVKAGDEVINNAVVTWSGNNDDVATIDAKSGTVTLVAAGSVTFTATYEGVADTYKPSTKTYTLTVLDFDPNSPGTENNPYNVADAIAFINTLGSSASATEVYVSGIISQVQSYNSSYSSITYWISDDGTTEGQMQVYSGKGLDGASFASINDLKVGDIVTVKGYVKKYNSTYEFDKNNVLVSFERPVVTTPTLTVSNTSLTGFIYEEGYGPSEPQTFDLTAESLTGDVTLTLDNQNFEISVSETEDYASSLIRPMSEFGSKTIFVRLKAGLDVNETYSGTITISSEGAEDKTVTLGGKVKKYVPDYTTLPFVFNSGRADIESTAGLTQDGLGTDYNSTTAPNTRLKFDTTGDNLILKLNEAAGTLVFDIKGNSFSGSTFTVQTSSDGLTYRDLMTYTDLADTQTEAFALAPEVRFIKWIYTNKASGNVGLGNIKVVDWNETAVVGDAKYATYVPEHDVIFPVGIEAYIGGIEKDYIALTAVKAVSKDTPVILKNTGRYTLIPVSEEKLDDVTGNLLKASDGKVTGEFVYVLAKPENEKVGFYRINEGTFVPAGKAYLEGDGTGPLVKAFFFAEEGETAINNVNVNDNVNNAAIYNIAGQRINKLQKGINIVNGKKVLF